MPSPANTFFAAALISNTSPNESYNRQLEEERSKPNSQVEQGRGATVLGTLVVVDDLIQLVPG